MRSSSASARATRSAPARRWRCTSTCRWRRMPQAEPHDAAQRRAADRRRHVPALMASRAAVDQRDRIDTAIDALKEPSSASAAAPAPRCASSTAAAKLMRRAYPPDAVVWPESTAEVSRSCARATPAARAGHRLRRRHLARRPRQRAVRRHLHRHVAHGPGAGGARRGPRLRRAAGHHARGAQRLAARHRPVLPGRSGRQRDARRHDLHPRLRHHHGAVRLDRAQRARAAKWCWPTAASSAAAAARANPRPATTWCACSPAPKARSASSPRRRCACTGARKLSAAACCSFPTLRGAVDAVIELIQSGAPLARIEFLDEVQVRACNAYSKLALPEQPTLFIEFNGTEASVTEQFARAARSSRAQRRRRASVGLRRAEARAACGRRGTRPISPRWRCVPAANASSRTSACRSPRWPSAWPRRAREIDAARPDRADRRPRRRRQLPRAVPARPGDADERAAHAERVYDAMIEHAHRVEGTCTGEHGIGLGKRDKLVAEFGEPVVELMRATQGRLGSARHPQSGESFPQRPDRSSLFGGFIMQAEFQKPGSEPGGVSHPLWFAALHESRRPRRVPRPRRRGRIAATTIEQVTVTARKRDESLVDVPISITAVSGRAWIATRCARSRTSRRRCPA